MWTCPNCGVNVQETSDCDCGYRETPGTVTMLRVIGVTSFVLSCVSAFAALVTGSVALCFGWVLEGIVVLALFYGFALIAKTLVSIDNQIRVSAKVHTRLLASIANTMPVIPSAH
jgi:hypothetical protein